MAFVHDVLPDPAEDDDDDDDVRGRITMMTEMTMPPW